jgi:hypothetical protein
MADHNLPVLTSLYSDYTAALKARHDDALKMLDPATTSPTNVPINAIRFSSAAAKWQRWNGTAWVDPVVSYAININGNVTGNVSGNVTGNVSGNAGTATALATARNIGGVPFNGTANIDLPGVNTSGNQNTSGNAASASVASSLTPDALLAVLVQLYPIGSIYINASVTTNPATLLGFGTWVAFGTGRVMVALDGSDLSFNVLERTGGSKNATLVNHSHDAYTHISDPGHNHTLSGRQHAGASGSLNEFGDDLDPAESFSNNTSVKHAYTGISAYTSVGFAGSSATNANLQPYITVAMWKRTA